MEVLFVSGLLYSLCMRISLVRHGQKQSNLGNPPLTPRGQEQAKQTGAFFSSLSVTHIFASPLLRTQQTAESISLATGLPFFTNPLLRERGEWNLVDGMNWDEFLNEWRLASANREYQPKYGDSSRSAGERVEIAIEEVFGEHNIEHAVLVSHGGTITDFLRNTFSDDFLIEKYYGHYQNLLDTAVPECSVTTLLYKDGAWELERICFTEHLAE